MSEPLDIYDISASFGSIEAVDHRDAASLFADIMLDYLEGSVPVPLVVRVTNERTGITQMVEIDASRELSSADA